MIKFSFLGAPFPYHYPLSLQIPARILETRLTAYQMVRNHVVLRITDAFQQPRFSSLHAWFLLPFGYISPDVFLSQSLHDYVTARSTHPNSQVCLDICKLSRHISRVADIESWVVGLFPASTSIWPISTCLTCFLSICPYSSYLLSNLYGYIYVLFYLCALTHAVLEHMTSPPFPTLQILAYPSGVSRMLLTRFIWDAVITASRVTHAHLYISPSPVQVKSICTHLSAV